MDRNPRLKTPIALGFDDAARHCIKLGETSSSGHIHEALRIIEQMRAATISDREKPKDGPANGSQVADEG